MIIQNQTFYDPINKIWSGVKVPIDGNLDLSLGKVLIDKLLENPEHIGQICCHNGKEFTNQEIADAALSIACHLNELGFQQGEVVGFMCSNTEYVAPLVIGALLNGLAISPLDVSYEKDSIKHICSITKPSIMFCDGMAYERVRSNFEEMGFNAKIYTMVDHIDGEPNIMEFLNASSQDKDNFKIEKLRDGGNQIAFIVCSSGTTGLPKGVCMSHASLRNPHMARFLTSGDKLFCFSSLYWASGIISLVSGSLRNVIRLITRNTFSVEEFLNIVQKFKPTVVLSPPSHLSLALGSPLIYNSDFSSIKKYICGGSAVTPSLIAKVKTLFPLNIMQVIYGMSEVPVIGISGGPAEENGSVGKLAKNIEMQIRDDDNNRLGPNQIGEIVVRNNLPFAGYFGNREASAAACDKDGWILSGDLGYMADNGNLFIVDRKKEIYKYNNFHFYPTEIEGKIMEISDVVETCVCGIPDEISSFLPAAMVVPKAGSKITEKDIYEYVANQMENYKHLRGGVYFVEKIPKTPSGKNIRRKVVEMCVTLRNNENN